ncbi:MAG: glycosyltransferase family 1 protein [Candidatus Zixiibacteriota bacterium]|jgi:glycosyltransferase involved in cell wall biosynthesis
MAELTVAMDARYLGGERKGIGRYLHTLLSGMEAMPDPPAFVFLTDRELELPYAGFYYRVVVVTSPTVYTWEQCALPREARRSGARVFHAPGNALPYRLPGPTVLTLHDAMMFEREFHTWTANRYYVYQSWVLRRAARHCETVITVSETSANDIREKLGPEVAERMTVVPEAVDPIFFEQRSAAELSEFRERLGLPERYLLHFGAAFPRKNTRNVVEGYGRAAEAGDLPPLVVAGIARDDESTVRGWVAAAGAGDTRVQSYLPPADHARLVAGAELLVYPSLYEGFGLPALEAMAVGVPVVSSRRGALPETCGDAAHYVETDAAALADAMVALSRDEGARRTLAAAGREHVKKYSPERMAGATLDIYRKAARNGER